MGLENKEVYQSEVQISGCYKILKGTSPPPSTLIEHCCLRAAGNGWNIEVKCRPILHGTEGSSQHRANWRSVKEVYPDSKVELKHNDVEVTLPSLQEDLEIAAFGRPGKNDQKRMQMAIFATRPTQGRNWKIWVHLVDDTVAACKKICQEEEKRGNRLLTPLSGIFVSNSNEDITIELTLVEPGWEIQGSSAKTINSSYAWNSQQSSTHFAHCYFEISHVNKTKHSFFCGIEASHKGDSARAEVVAYFEPESGKNIIQPSINFRKLSNSCNYVSREKYACLPIFFFLFYSLFTSDFKTARFTGSTSVHHCTTKKVLQDFTNFKQQENVIEPPPSRAPVKRRKTGRAARATASYSLVPQDHAHRATARKPDDGCRKGNALNSIQKQSYEEVY